MSKDRADVIIPGLAILSEVWRHTAASRLVVCGNGMRDGLFFETCLPGLPEGCDNPVLEASVRNLNALYPAASPEHLAQVRRLASALFDAFSDNGNANFPPGAKDWLDTAARLFRIGAAIDLNDCAGHTFDLLVHTPWYGLSHREALLTAAIASFRGVNGLRRKLAPFRSMLREGHGEMAAKLGAILQLAAALDRSESQAVRGLRVEFKPGKLLLMAETNQPLTAEQLEVEAVAKDFQEIWGAAPVLNAD